jgi:hypothetical protein
MKYAVRDGLSCHDIYIYMKFHRNWFRHSKLDRRGTHKPTLEKRANRTVLVASAVSLLRGSKERC